jgi:hypothetical protein
VTETRYETDFCAWLQTQAALLRAKEWSHVRILLLHLLKWAYQPERRGRSCRRSILLARQHLTRRLQDSPSLRPELPAFVSEAYANARHLAAVETDLPIAAFPEICPWTLDQIEDEAFLPEP